MALVCGTSLHCTKRTSCKRSSIVVVALATVTDVNVWSRRNALIAAANIPAWLMATRIEATGEPSKLELVENALEKVITKGKAPGILRLVFHDAGTYDLAQDSGGMNGSIIYELTRSENDGLQRPVKILEKARAILDPSTQDLIAVAGSRAVQVCGGPIIPVTLGRLDSHVPDAEGKLPSESSDAASLKACFLRKGFSTQELVVLSGAHTIGAKGFGDADTFDNTYFQILLKKPWIDSANNMSVMVGLPSDRALVDDDECVYWLNVYADDQAKFFQDFSAAYVKLINSGARYRA